LRRWRWSCGWPWRRAARRASGGLGIGFGLVLEGLRFGFAGPWRAMIADRDARGLNAQLLAIGAGRGGGLSADGRGPGRDHAPAHAPVGFGMILGAFVFGAAMQVVMGCGSGTLVNAGSGNHRAGRASGLHRRQLPRHAAPGLVDRRWAPCR
jgi:uncharacterized membrane protein YedE/YeeE